ncbi:uncharacterized protein RSE6_11167 [Rhynchosporium secalis]|uniref:Uncharacterized protein n=1 Tax=Rhynchosporium secalis TaxID=38038 RepID=A0A1E1MMB0_RHYSE|nr:uncharacterized protein RSE6_11167 [Rhynchosporium secalis]
MHDYIHTKPNQTSPAITPITEPIIQSQNVIETTTTSSGFISR